MLESLLNSITAITSLLLLWRLTQIRLMVVGSCLVSELQNLEVPNVLMAAKKVLVVVLDVGNQVIVFGLKSRLL